MQQNTNKYQYEQLDTYKEILELRHLKVKTLIVNILNVVFAVIVGLFLLELEVESRFIYSILFMFLMLFIINVMLYSYNNDLYNNLKLAMYVNVIGEYIIAIALIVVFKTPSIFTVLFLAYAITAIYQDYKAMTVSNGLLFSLGFLSLLRVENLFSIPGNTTVSTILIIVFLVLFVLLLTLSSYILIKRKSFFYNHLAQIKESELRNMAMLDEINYIKNKSTLNSAEYYKSLQGFSKELSKKIGIENVFSRKIKLLKDLKKYNMTEMMERYQDYTQDEINELKLMELSVTNKMKTIGLKASKSSDVQVSRKEIFSESQFKSFKHSSDHRYTRIISFVVFYCLLKINKPYMKELEEEKIKDILLNSEYYYLVDPDIMKIYVENNEVFDTVVNDILKGKWSYE